MFDGKYLEWNQKRIKEIIEFYKVKFFYMKKVLDLGSGHGDIATAFSRLGADVTAVDARADHLKMITKKAREIKTVKADLDQPLPFIGRKFDLVFDMGLLCHLTNFESHLRQVCSITTHLVLETTVCDSVDENKVEQIKESSSVYDLAFNGISSRPTAAMIERILAECGMNFKRMDSSKFNCGDYVYDWKEKNNCQSDSNKRRIWFCVRNTSPVQFANPAKLSAPQFILQSHSIQNSGSFANPKNPSFKELQQKPSLPQVRTNHADFLNSLCLSGKIDNVEETYTALEPILKTLNPKLFICTINATQQKMKLIREKFNPEKLTNISLKNIKVDEDKKQIYAYFQSLQEANKLKEAFEQEKSAIFNSTTHAKFDSDFNVDFNKYSDLSRVYIKDIGEKQVIFSESMLSDIYSSLYDNIDSYLAAGCKFTVEDLTKYLLSDFSLPIELM